MSGVAVDAQDDVWVKLARSNPPNRSRPHHKPNGRFTRAWGTGLLDTPHQFEASTARAMFGWSIRVTYVVLPGAPLK